MAADWSTNLKLGIVSDIHCNIEGLREALRLLGPIDRLLCLGDSIYEYRFSNDVINCLRENDAMVIKGNHEEVFYGANGTRARANPNNDPELLNWLELQPHRRTLEYDGRTILMVHSTPWEPRGQYIYPHSPELAQFAESQADVVLYGHTHQQVARWFDSTLVINPGSAGEGRDHRNGRQLSCARLELTSFVIDIIDFPNPALS